MAVRNAQLGGTDWSDGEILYADDLNDTFNATIAAGANNWERVGTELRPVNAGDSVVKNSSGNLGSASNLWDSLYADWIRGTAFGILGSDGNYFKIISTAGSSPDQHLHFIADYTKQAGATEAIVFFGFNSEISTYRWHSLWNGSNKALMELDAINERLGLFIASPEEKIHLRCGDENFAKWEAEAQSDARFMLINYSSGADWHKPALDFMRARGSRASPADILADDQLGIIHFMGFYSGTWYDSAAISARVDGAPSVTMIPTRLNLRVKDDTGTNHNATLYADGTFEAEKLRVGTAATGDYLSIDQNGQITLHGNAKVEKSIEIYPLAFDLSMTNAAQRGYLAGTSGILFDPDTQEYASCSIIIPNDIDLAEAPKLLIRVAPTANQTTGSTFVFQLECRYIAEGEAINKPVDETLTQSVVVSDTALIETSFEFALTSGLIAPGDRFTFILSRLAGDPADDRNGDAAVVGAKFIYTSNKV
ncbi:MAG TPA: hypothetical protein ENG10_00755 [Candidatus Bathyarchaeota archaeon]|nr:hypothetical protein [Candidatus Bathyarchaeota archaeon]HEX68811.1 hypothetical protein [Candidatus Bathyarchaeota archaeon]